jgi:L-glyceraldehyde 3-phosphate reductase
MIIYWIKEENIMPYQASETRYEHMVYRRCGRSGIRLPAISLGLWNNFGGVDRLENARTMLRTAFDRGICHFDLANDYGPPPGSAEENFGKIFAQDFRPYRDEILVSTKAGWPMWPGPYGDWGSRKYLVASLDQSLKRMGLAYVDIFYHHRPDPETPLEETMAALDFIVRSGRALYVGISSYSHEETRRAVQIARGLGTPLLLHQPSYNMFDRWIEDGLTGVLREESLGCIVFSPLAQGLLSTKYLDGIPVGSRAARANSDLPGEEITAEVLGKVRRLNAIAQARGQTLPQMALAWNLRLPEVTAVLIGASSPEQVLENLKALDNLYFAEEELALIEAALQ